MKPDEPLDDQFAELLAAYEGTLVDGAAPTAKSPPPELKARLDEALRCVEMLQQMWPQAETGRANESDLRGERYRLQKLHAIGGVGQVWLAEDGELGREVALKELRPERADDARFARRFLQEARITGRLQHPGIVPVYEVADGVDGEPSFYTMRFVRGKTLTEAISTYHHKLANGTSGPLELNALLTAFVSVCHTVAYAHSQAIIHRDLKTANVVLGDFGEVVLLDWGFAQELGQHEESLGANTEVTAAPGHTIAGQVVGTPGYMAPEQAAGERERIGRHTDVYGLGAILYEILTGRPPFAGTETSQVLLQAQTETPLRPEQVRRGVAPALAAVCMRALAREPSERYPGAAELARDIQRWLGDEPTEVYREPPGARVGRWGRRHKPLMAGVSVLVLTGFAALMIGLVLVEKEQARTAEVRVRAAAEKAEAEAEARDELESHLYVERLALAERELAAHNLARATQLLADCPPERRGWEWACLQRLCDADQRILRGHAGPVSGAVFCLDGNRVVSASHDRSLKIWDSATGHELATIPGHPNVIHCLAVSPDGKRFASGSWDRTVKIWDAASGQEIRTLGGHPKIVIRVAFAPDNRLLASVSGRTVTLWDTTTGAKVRSFDDPTSEVYGLAISPDGMLLATGTGDNVIRIQKLASGEEVRVLHGHRAAPKHLAFSPDGRLLAAGDGDTLQDGPGAVKIWDVASGTLAADLQGHTYPVFSVAFSPDGKRLFSGSKDNSIKIWDIDRKQLVLTLRGHADVVRSLAFSPDGLRLASASSDRTVRIWDASPSKPEETDRAIRVLKGHAARLIGVGFVGEGKRVASLSYDSALRVWNAGDGALVRTASVDPKLGSLHSFDAAPQGSLVAMGTSSGAVVFMDTDTGKMTGVCPGFGAGPVKGVAFSNDAKRVASAEWRHTVCVWDVKTCRPVHVLKGHSEPVVAVAYSPDDRFIASASQDQTAILWDADKAQALHTFAGHSSRLTAVTFSPDGKLLATAAHDGLIKLWQVDTRQPIRELRGHTAAVNHLVFAPDSHRLFSASDDWTLIEWDITRGEASQTFRGHTSAVRSVAVNPQRKLLASGSQDETVRIWEVRP